MNIEPGSGTLTTEHGTKVHARSQADGPLYMTPCGIAGHVDEEGVELAEKDFREVDEERRCDSCEEQVLGNKNIRRKSSA